MSDSKFMPLISAKAAEGKFVCVGLDSDASRLPKHLRVPEGTDPSDRQNLFNRAIVDATEDIVCAYKPNLAFYRGGNGKYALRDTIAYIKKTAPDVPVILDAKQGDIGNTNNGYIAEDFDWMAADAVTVHNYLGMEAMRPFLDQKDKGVIVLCKTSNEGAAEFQDLPVGPRKMPLYQVVARNVAHGWNYNGNCCLVVGATYTKEMAEVRAIAPEIPFLIPGIGTQGGSLEDTVRAGATASGRGMIINNGSAIIFASDGENFAEAAREATQKMDNDIKAVLATF